MSASDRSAGHVASIAAMRRAVVDRGAELRAAGDEVAADRAELLLAGAATEQELEAMKRRETVGRMSREGASVRDIAAATRLSYGHVVAIRSRLGVGRTR